MHQLLAAALVRPSLPSRCAVSMSVSPSDDLLPGFRLSGVVQGTEDDEELSLWLGDYKLERRNIPGQPRNPRKLLREVMGRPAYRHEELPSRWLVWNGARWIGMLTEDLPWGFGIMQELGRSEYDRAQDPNMKYSTVSLPMDVASPAEAGQQPCEWCVASRGEWLEAPGLRCEAMSEAELEAAADERRSKRRSRGPSNEDGAFLEVCHCVACDRQGADLTLKMFRQLGADAVPTPTKGTCGGGPMVYIGMSDLKLGGSHTARERTENRGGSAPRSRRPKYSQRRMPAARRFRPRWWPRTTAFSSLTRRHLDAQIRERRSPWPRVPLPISRCGRASHSRSRRP